MRTFRRARWIVVLGALAAVAASVSYAAIPSLNGTIHACLDSKGALKVIDVETGGTCAADKKLLTWNQRGSQGDPGPQGSQGIQGPQGASGPSDAYVERAPDLGLAGLWYPSTVASVDLPAGKYVIFAKVWLHNPQARVDHKCTLVAGNDQDEQVLETGVNDNQVNIDLLEDQISLMTAHEFASPGAASVICSSKWGQTTVKKPVITAIKVGNLTIS